jgi:hypothetical protein
VAHKVALIQYAVVPTTVRLVRVQWNDDRVPKWMGREGQGIGEAERRGVEPDSTKLQTAKQVTAHGGMGCTAGSAGYTEGMVNLLHSVKLILLPAGRASEI